MVSNALLVENKAKQNNLQLMVNDLGKKKLATCKVTEEFFRTTKKVGTEEFFQ